MSRPDYHLIGKRLRERRVSLREEQYLVAKHVGVTVDIIDKIECGTHQVSTTELTKFAQFLGMHVGELFTKRRSKGACQNCGRKHGKDSYGCVDE